MTNEEIRKALEQLTERIAICERSNNGKESKALRAKYRALYRKYQFNFVEGEKVEIQEGDYRWVQAQIVERTRENYFIVSKGAFGEVKVTGFVLRTPQAHLQNAVNTEQPSLF